MTIQEVLSKFQTSRKTANGYRVRCPAHDDDKPSLHISEGETGIVFFCHAGCETKRIVESLGFELKDLFYEPLERSSIYGNGHKRIVAAYEYRDARGDLLYQVVRYEPKDFRQRRPDGAGGWIWKLDDTPRVPYRLKELLDSDPDDYVFIVEGEADADALSDLGLIATCNVGGAGKWRDEYSQFFDNRIAIIIPDNDDPGAKHASQIYASLSNYAENVTVAVLTLPGLPPKGDVRDWLKLGGTVDELRKLAGLALLRDPDSEPTPAEALDLPSAVLTDDTLHTDLGNATRFFNKYGPTTRYVYARKLFLCFDGRTWNDDQSIVERRASKIICELRDVKFLDDQARDTAAFKHFINSQKPERRNAMLTLARSEMKIEVEHFDANPTLLNVYNGTIDLETGKLLPHDPHHLCTKLSRVKYDPAATCPRWYQFLSEIFSTSGQIEDEPSEATQELVRFIQKAVGYSLSGLTIEQVFFILYGIGRNGKSTFLNILARLAGNYATHAQMETFTSQHRTAGHSEDVARLRGARIITAVETEESKRLSEGLIKQITGGDPVTASYKNEHTFTFTPIFKLWLAANHKPIIRGTDEGIWRRPLMVPFLIQFEKDPAKALAEGRPQADLGLETGLVAELPGILNWAIKGFRLWQAENLTPPSAVRSSTDQYRKDSDLLGSYIEERLITKAALLKRGAKVASKGTNATLIYKDYCLWCSDNGEYAVTQTKFGNSLVERGFRKEKDGGQVIYFDLFLIAQGGDDSPQ